MEYRAVNNRCALILDSMNLPISHQEALEILAKKKFKILEIDLIRLARQCIQTSIYRRGAKLSEAPAVVDCSSFMKWLYAQCGIWLPRRSIQQREYGETIPLHEIIRNDLIFVSGHINYYYDNPANGIGHVGIFTGEGTVIHAANKRLGVIETSLQNFTDEEKFRGVCRYIPRKLSTLIMETPLDLNVETADDIKWIILQSLP